MDKVRLFGLSNCDSTQAAIKWFEQNGIETNLHNYKTEGITKKKLEEWVNLFGWEKVLNKRSTTWRSLKKEEQDSIVNQSVAIDLMHKHTSLIKRPVIESGKDWLIGFDEKKLSDTFK